MIQPENQILVIFGASGDLTKRKLIPAIFDLAKQNLLPDKFAIIGVGRTKLDDFNFRKKMNADLYKYGDASPEDKNLVDQFCEKLYYQALNTSDLEEYSLLKEKINLLLKELSIPANIIFYLSTPPSLYEIIPENLAKTGLNNSNKNSGWKRLIVEKPFGTDLESAKKLNRSLLNFFNENQIYRIDHYLGKETVQNVLVTRFANGIFEPLWNRNFIDRVEITSSESIGVEGRGGYYDHSGVLRDMVQNHLLQIVGLIAMEPPVEISPLSIRNETMKVFQSLRSLKVEDVKKNVIRAQYVSSTIKGEKVPGYRDEEGVSDNSRTETFVAMKFFIDNWRWSGVPFLIRVGKRLPTRVTEVVVHFKKTPHTLFRNISSADHQQNQLVIRIQPDEGLLLKFGTKVPGAGFQVQDVNMDFHYSDLNNTHLPSAYERLLLDCMLGDSTLYARGDAVEVAWEFVQPILDVWKKDCEVPLYGYPAGTWGPNDEVKGLLDDAGKDWRYPCKNLSNDGEYCEL
ncbi:MAG: glucose-6-phosphate dehydrogenase [Bacteroidales bacterium]|nr:glucose-6-phosphate dehydrogenase [Bacteroidales bacterium]MBN2819962.1 glucose-6-phosphate dehydrogenase [Bacteroidales bacterium]